MWRFKGVEYTINEKTKDCSKTRLTKEFIPLQVEDGAKWEGDFTIGAPQIKGGQPRVHRLVVGDDQIAVDRDVHADRLHSSQDSAVCFG